MFTIFHSFILIMLMLITYFFITSINLHYNSIRYIRVQQIVIQNYEENFLKARFIATCKTIGKLEQFIILVGCFITGFVESQNYQW
jgi:hypothetical protein